MSDFDQIKLEETKTAPYPTQDGQGGYPPAYNQPPQAGTYPDGTYPQAGYPQGSYPQAGYPPLGPGQAGYQTPGPGQPTIIYQTQPDNTTAQVPSIVAAYVTSCLVFWCCNCLFGAIGFFIALAASSAIGSNQIEKAKSLWKASIIVSVVGIVVSLVIVGTILGLCFSGNPACPYSYSNYYG